MTELSALLSGHLPAGVYRWRPEEAPGDDPCCDGAADLAHGAGWSLADVAAGETACKADALAAVGVALRFPGTYGRNLDALVDLLDDLAVPTLLRWSGWQPLAAADPGTFAVLLQIFTERADDPLSPPFAVLLVDDLAVPDDLPGRDLPLLA